jgi:hypothetical protein
MAESLSLSNQPSNVEQIKALYDRASNLYNLLASRQIPIFDDQYLSKKLAGQEGVDWVKYNGDERTPKLDNILKTPEGIILIETQLMFGHSEQHVKPRIDSSRTGQDIEMVSSWKYIPRSGEVRIWSNYSLGIENDGIRIIETSQPLADGGSYLITPNTLTNKPYIEIPGDRKYPSSIFARQKVELDGHDIQLIEPDKRIKDVIKAIEYILTREQK